MVEVKEEIKCLRPRMQKERSHKWLKVTNKNFKEFDSSCTSILKLSTKQVNTTTHLRKIKSCICSKRLNLFKCIMVLID